MMGCPPEKFGNIPHNEWRRNEKWNITLLQTLNEITAPSRQWSSAAANKPRKEKSDAVHLLILVHTAVYKAGLPKKKKKQCRISFKPLLYRKYRGQSNITNDTTGIQMVRVRMTPLLQFKYFSWKKKMGRVSETCNQTQCRNLVCTLTETSQL